MKISKCPVCGKLPKTKNVRVMRADKSSKSVVEILCCGSLVFGHCPVKAVKDTLPEAVQTWESIVRDCKAKQGVPNG